MQHRIIIPDRWKRYEAKPKRILFYFLEEITGCSEKGNPSRVFQSFKIWENVAFFMSKVFKFHRNDLKVGEDIQKISTSFCIKISLRKFINIKLHRHCIILHESGQQSYPKLLKVFKAKLCHWRMLEFMKNSKLPEIVDVQRSRIIWLMTKEKNPFLTRQMLSDFFTVFPPLMSSGPTNQG